MRSNALFNYDVIPAKAGIQTALPPASVGADPLVEGDSFRVSARKQGVRRRAYGQRPLTLILLLAGLLLAASAVQAQTGKISGTATDALTGDTLPGVNLRIEGTAYGAATDLDGRYAIIGVPPGLYTVRASYVGFTEVVVEGVQVQSGLTTPLDVALTEAALDVGGEVVVTAERPPVQRDQTASAQILTFRQLEELPVTSAREGLFVQAGVFFDIEPIMGGLGGSGRGEPRYAVRGGDQTEVLWFVDGARTAALFEGRADQGGSYATINRLAVQELQILTGGFPAEYGGAQSGVVNVVTKEGGDDYEGTLEYLYGPSGQRHFGNYLYDPATQKEFLDHTLADGTLDPAWWTPLRQSQIYDYTALADSRVWGSLGGPLFDAGGVRAAAFVAGQYNREAYTYPHPIDHRVLDDVTGNATFQIAGGMKLKPTGLYSRSLHSTLQENGDYVSQVKYYRGWGSVLDTRHTLAAANWTHALTPSLFYDVALSAFGLDFREEPSDFTRLGVSANPTIFGFQPYDGFEDEPFDAYSYIFDRHERVGDLSLEASTTWQADAANLLKGGIEARYNTYDEARSFRFPSFTTDERYWLNRGLDETYHPLQFAAYVQDKMEFRSMILNLGLRYDYFNPNRDWFDAAQLPVLALDPLYDAALDPDGDQVDENGRVRYAFENVFDKPRTPAPSFHRISPRIGVSFPITAGSVLHFNYGHFYQLPPLDRMFEFSYFRPLYIVEAQQEEDALAAAEGRPPRHIPSRSGDPERVVALSLDALKPEKTISFEVGLAQQFGDVAVLNVTGFYKDVFDQTLPRVGLFDRIVTLPTGNFVSSFSGDYGDSRGFEINLQTLFSEHVTLDFNYSFSRSTQGRATPGRVAYDTTGTATFTYDQQASLRLPAELTNSRPHLFRANLFLRYPEDGLGGEGRAWYDRILSGASASFLGRYVSGRAFTYLGPDDPPDTVDNQRLPPLQTLDLRLEKPVHLGPHRLSVYTLVSNVFDTQNLRAYGEPFFDATATPNFVENGTVSTVDAGGFDISAQTYFPRRHFQFGVRYDFR